MARWMAYIAMLLSIHASVQSSNHCSTCLTSEFDIFARSISTSLSTLSGRTASMTESPLDLSIVTTTSATSLLPIASLLIPELDSGPSSIATSSLSSIYFNSTDLDAIVNDNSSDSSGDRFLSFEEWKKVKQEDAASVLNNGTVVNGAIDMATKSGVEASTGPMQSPSCAPILNHLSETTLINLGCPGAGTASSNTSAVLDQGHVDIEHGKIYKDKFNYASVDCAATIVKTNSGAKGASSVLVENKDTYLLNQCMVANKFIVIELCQDILLDSVVVGNYEFFSSTFKDIRISVSDRFPTTQWELVGEFVAENIRDVQTFAIVNPLIWARYLKLEILSHYGNEFYCPLSIVRVHGKTMMEEFKMEVELQQHQHRQQQLQQQTHHQQQQPQQPTNSLYGDLDLEALRNLLTPDTSEECAVVLPHLGVLQFLDELNDTDSLQICYDFENDTSPDGAAHSTTQPAVETKTTQESIYRNIMKRLSLLETNATLSLLYIEEQSKLLSIAFTKLERRQTNNFQSLVDTFVATMSDQLNFFRTSYLNTQTQASTMLKQQETTLVAFVESADEKIVALGNELRFQKRLALFNSLVIILLLVYVLLVGTTVCSPSPFAKWMDHTSVPDIEHRKESDGKEESASQSK